MQLFDSWAGVLDERRFRRYVIAPTRRIVEELRKRYPAMPIIGFPRGAGLMYRAYVGETRIGALGLDTGVPPGIARKTLQSLVPVQGNLDPVLLLSGGVRLEEAVAGIVACFRDGPFVFNLGHGVLPGDAGRTRRSPRRIAAPRPMSRCAVVLFNLGGPDRLESVEPFLFNLFNDPAIIALPAVRCAGRWRGSLPGGARASRAGSMRGSAGARRSSPIPRRRRRRSRQRSGRDSGSSSPCATGRRLARPPPPR